MILISLLTEIFVFNIRTFQSAGFDERAFDESYSISVENGSVIENGDIVIDDGQTSVSLIIDGFDYELNNIKADIECIDDIDSPQIEDHVCVVRCSQIDDAYYDVFDDEGGTRLEKMYSATTEKRILHSIPESCYIWLETYGTTDKLKLEISSASGIGKTFRINDIRFNAVKPMRFSFLRFLMVFLLVNLFYFTFAGLLTRNECCIDRKMWKAAIPVVILIVIGIPVIVLNLSNGLETASRFSPYAELARSMATGKVSVGEASETAVLNEDNIVFWNVYSDIVKFDYSIFGDKYYVYFGVMPCLVFFLPYYLLTGNDLPVFIPVILLCGIIAVLIHILLGMIIRRYYSNVSYRYHAMMAAATACGMYLPFFCIAADSYQIPILMGVAFLLAGVIFWSRAEMSKIWMITCGSICMAGVSLCRPTMMLYVLILTAIFCVKSLNGGTQTDRVKKIKISASVLLPYAVIGGICMYYNYIRFGSVIDFGASYNLTTLPTRGSRPFIAFIILRDIYEYLFRPLSLNFNYPYISWDGWDQIYEAGTQMAAFSMPGGLFITSPVLFMIPVGVILRKKIVEKDLFRFSTGMAVAGTVLMFFTSKFTSTTDVRYTLEFSAPLFFAACIIVLEWLNKNDQIPEILEAIFRGLFLISILFGIMQLASGEGTMYGLSAGNTELYYRLFYTFNFMG